MKIILYCTTELRADAIFTSNQNQLINLFISATLCEGSISHEKDVPRKIRFLDADI